MYIYINPDTYFSFSSLINVLLRVHICTVVRVLYKSQKIDAKKSPPKKCLTLDYKQCDVPYIYNNTRVTCNTSLSDV